MISSFSISNFKALHISNVHFNSRLNVLIGLNGAGKSSVLQSIDMVCGLANNSGLEGWLSRRDWNARDIPTRLSAAYSPTLPFVLGLKSEEQTYTWEGTLNLHEGFRKCTNEKITNGESMVIAAKQNKIVTIIYNGKRISLDMQVMNHSGSFMSIIRPESLADCIQTISKCSSLDLLSPHLMRSHVRKASSDGVGLGGEFIAPYLKSLKGDSIEEYNKVIKTFFPTYDSFIIKRLRGGALVLYVKETFTNGNSCISEASMLCDGILRVMAIIAQAFACKGGTLLIDELEDGFNPELLEKLVVFFATKAPCQTIITTHSPLVLSLLTIEEAENGVHLVYKDASGISRCAPFFSLKTPKEMLKHLYPGEVLLRCKLDDISKEAMSHVQ